MEMIKIRKNHTVWFFFFVFLFVFHTCLYAQSLIKYLPHNEDMDSLTKKYSPAKVLGELPCSEGPFQEAANCYSCIQEWLPSCNECCIGFDKKTGSRIVKCTGTDYPLNPALLDSPCECQSLVLPAGKCKQNKGIGPWYCKEGGLSPTETCLKKMHEEVRPQECKNITPPFFLPPEKVDTDPASKTKECPGEIGSPCFKYVASGGLQSCITKCEAYNSKRKDQLENIEDCKKGSCPDVSVCADKKDKEKDDCIIKFYDTVCTRDACKKIVANPKCIYGDEKVAKDCADITNKCIDCLLTETCSRCFQQIDPTFFYKFVAKSRESETVIFEIGSNPEIKIKGKPASDTSITKNEAAPALHLYTRIKVFEAGHTEPIYESPIHQKYLAAAFSIFCAAHIDKDKLRQGKAYEIRLYYYLPRSLEYELSVKISNLRLILVRIRE